MYRSFSEVHKISKSMVLSFADSRTGFFRTLQYYFMMEDFWQRQTEPNLTNNIIKEGTHKQLKADAKQDPSLYKTEDGLGGITSFTYSD